MDTEFLLIYGQQNNFWNLKKKKNWITAAECTELSHIYTDQGKGWLATKIK